MLQDDTDKKLLSESHRCIDQTPKKRLHAAFFSSDKKLDLTKSAAQVFEACRISDRLFVFHPFFRRVNFYSQQLRALALVETIFKNKLVKEGRRNVVIVGAGVGGMTAAAAFATVGCSVLIVDRGKPLEIYKDANHRELHPNVVMWPFQELLAITELPFLNWSCGPASVVVRQILDQWREDFSHCVELRNGDVTSVTETRSAVTVNFVGGEKVEGDMVIVAAGFGREDGVGSFKSAAYWDPYKLVGEDLIVVSGSGDGALIDGAYQMFRASAVMASRKLAYAFNAKPLRLDILSKEQEALKLVENGLLNDAHNLLEDFYSKLRAEPEELQMLLDLQSADMPIHLLHRDATAFSPYASPINKVMISVLKNKKDSKFVINKIASISEIGGQIQVSSGSSSYVVDKNRLIIRHGAPRNALHILSKSQAKVLEAKNSNILAAPVPNEFDRRLFIERANRHLAPTNRTRAVAFRQRIQEFLQSLINYVTNSNTAASIVSSGDASEAWKVVPQSPDIHRILSEFFPMITQSVKIELADSGEAGRNYRFQ